MEIEKNSSTNHEERKMKVLEPKNEIHNVLPQRNLKCRKCGITMAFVAKQAQGVEETFPALVCEKCGEFRFLQTTSVLMSRIVGLQPYPRKLIKLNQNLALSMPQEYTRAFNLQKGDEVELSVEGFNKVSIRILSR